MLPTKVRVVHHWLATAALVGGLAGCGVASSPQPQPVAEDFAALTPVLAASQPYALPDAPITTANADQLGLVGILANRGEPRALAKSPNGRLLALGTTRGVYLHDARTLAEQRFLDAPPVRLVSFSPDGRLLAVYAESALHQTRVWRLDDGALVSSLDIQPAQGTSIYPAGIAFSPDGEQVYAAYFDFSKRITILAWQLGHESAGREVFAFDPGFGWEANLSRLIIAPAYDLVIIALFGRVEVHRLSQQQRLFTVEAPPEEVRSAALSPDGRQLVVGLTGGKVQSWEVPEGKLLREFVIPEGRLWASHLTFSPDGRQLMAALDEDVYIWSLLNPAEAAPSIVKLEPGAEILDAQFSPDPSVVHVLLKDELRNAWVADGTTAQVIGEYLRGAKGIAFSADGQWLAGAFEYRIGLWRVRDGVLLRRTASFASEMPSSKFGDVVLSAPAPVADAIFSSDLRTAIFSVAGDVTFSKRGRGGLVQVRSANGVLRQTLRGYIHGYARLAISLDGRLMAGGDEKGVVLVWRLTDGLNLRALRGHREPIVGLAFSPDGRLLITAGLDESVKVWDVTSGRERQAVHASRDSRVVSIALSPTGQRLAVLTRASRISAQVAFWEADKGGALNFARELKIEGVEILVPLLDRPHNPMMFSPDGRLMAFADDENVYLVDADQASLKWVIKADSEVQALAFSPDGRLLALATADGGLLLYGAA